MEKSQAEAGNILFLAGDTGLKHDFFRFIEMALTDMEQ